MFANKINYINRFILISSIIVILLPFAQISGPFFTDFFISICALGYLIFIIILRREFHINNKYLNILLIFWLFIIVSSLFSDYKSLSLRPSLTFFRFIIFCYVIVFIINRNKDFLEKFNISVIIALSLLIFDGYFQFIFGKNIIGLEQMRPDRLSSFFGDELILGSYLCKFLPLILYLYYQNIKIKKIKLFNSIIIIFILPLIFLSGERAAFFMSILFCLLVTPFLFTFKKFIVIILSFLILGLFIIKSNKIIYDRYINQLKYHLVIEHQNEIIYFPEHIGIFNSAYNNFLKNKIIGSGIKSFRETCKLNNSNYKKKILKIRPTSDFCSTHPHNYYLQFLSELGLLGFIFLTFTFIFCIIKYFKTLLMKYSNTYNDTLLLKKYIILLSGLIMLIWPVSTTGNFFNNYNSSFIFLNLSFFLYINNEFVSKIKK
ncbi:O-antigen ligase family protein [Candidatus Pelagibacter sp.]|nr:O-antigen ligase family protein [Candidatus Pelagibacter sp.]